jgi:ferredoxin-NADP reductase
MHQHTDNNPASEHSHEHVHDHEDESNTFVVKLVNKRQVAEGTMAFSFERPSGFQYKAGQHTDWQLIDPPETDAEGDSRTFSLVSSPAESQITFATRMRDTAFKRVLGRMNVGDSLQVASPHGSFTLHNDITTPAVFLIGGIGVTPVFSMIKDATERNLPHQLLLFYSNRRPEDAAFLRELTELAKNNSHFTFVPTMTEPEKSAQKWDGETGFIDQVMMEKYVKDVQSAIYYLSGPPAMVAAMRKLLNEVGLNEDRIKTEEFSGY